MSLDIEEPPPEPRTRAEAYRAIIEYLFAWCPRDQCAVVNAMIADADAKPTVDVEILAREYADDGVRDYPNTAWKREQIARGECPHGEPWGTCGVYGCVKQRTALATEPPK